MLSASVLPKQAVVGREKGVLLPPTAQWSSFRLLPAGPRIITRRMSLPFACILPTLWEPEAYAA